MIRRRACRRYAAVLFDLVDGDGPAAGDVDAALRHLDGCRQCRRDLDGIVPVVVRLRRLRGSGRARPDADDRWPVIRRSISASSAPSRRRPLLAWLSGPLGGIIAMPLVAVMLLMAVGPRLAVGPLAATPYLSETEGLPPPSGGLPPGTRIPAEADTGSADYLAFALAWATSQQTDSSVPSSRPLLRAEHVPVQAPSTPETTAGLGTTPHVGSDLESSPSASGPARSRTR